MIIRTLPSGPFATNAYVVGCPTTKQALLIDPGVESAASILKALKEEDLTPIKIVLTHSHWDHIGNVALLKEKLNIPVVVHALDAYNLIEPGSDEIPCWVKIPPVDPDAFIVDGESIPFGALALRVIHTPGHTPGGICLYNPEEHVLFSGDTLFKGTMGNISFSTGQPDLMWNSLAKLGKLPPETKVYPGHGLRTTIGEEPWLARAQKYFGDN